jgi:hypothetical protein
MIWHSVHVHYHDQNGHDTLLADAVRPLFATLADDIDSAFFTRHWLRGPHIRLNFQATPESFDNAVRPAVEQHIGRYLARFPSAGDSAERLLPLHQRLAADEEVDEPLVPWYPDNSIRDATYDDRIGILGSAEAADLLARFYSDSNEHALDLVHKVCAGAASATSLSFDLMIASAHVLAPGPLSDAFVSYRSHSEAFLARDPDGPRLRQLWQDHYAEHADILCERVRLLVAALDGGDRLPEPIHDWLRIMRPIHDRASELVFAGKIVMHELDESRERPDRDDQLLSEFHQALHRTSWWSEVYQSPEFGLYRLVLNFMYLQMSRIGARPIDRFMLGYLLANAVENVYDCSAFEMVGIRR